MDARLNLPEAYDMRKFKNYSSLFYFDRFSPHLTNLPLHLFSSQKDMKLSFLNVKRTDEYISICLPISKYKNCCLSHVLETLQKPLHVVSFKHIFSSVVKLMGHILKKCCLSYFTFRELFNRC